MSLRSEKIFCLLFLFFSLHLIADPSTEQKLAQLLFSYVDGPGVSDETRRLFMAVDLGGVILYESTNGLQDPAQVRSLCEELQALSDGLLIGIDQEGGRVSHLKGAFPSFPDNASVAATGDPCRVYNVASAIAAELKATGIHVNFAPVADVNCNPANPVIGTRAFGSDPELVSRFVQEALHAYSDAGIIACLKHFPGHGDVTVDSHHGLPVVQKSREELEAMEFIPFESSLTDSPMVMTAHVVYTALDGSRCATLSRPIIQDLLRGEMGYDGVVVSDSLRMQGVLDQAGSIQEAAIQALNAGCDLLMLGGRMLTRLCSEKENVDEVIAVHQALVDAERSGRISVQRIDEAYGRVLRLKQGMKQ
ncbi:MAG: beta-N-acetylhexosaminidase [Chlamydiia bacterium]|nr:beta-N-acetylhexosaminidase [Chlamydiia bacterium]